MKASRLSRADACRVGNGPNKPKPDNREDLEPPLALVHPLGEKRELSRVAAMDERQLSDVFRRTACSICERMVSIAFQIPLDQIRARTRFKAEAAFARQVAMYLSHVVFSIQLTDIGEQFCRDRTTVAHACGVVEDRRDDPVFDLAICQLEALLEEAKFGIQVFAARCEPPSPKLIEDLGLACVLGRYSSDEEAANK